MAVESINIRLETREETGKNKAKRLRKKGYLPAVFYGPGYKESVPVMVRIDDIIPHLHSSHWKTLVLNVTFPDGKEEMAMIRDYQRDPLTRQILHLDFYQILRGHKVMVAVPLVLTNKEDCIGVKKGGVLIQSLHEIEMEVLPSEIPDEIYIDVEGLDIGQGIRVSDIKLPESATISVDPEETIAQVVESSAMEAEVAAAEEEAPAEVEVIGKRGASEKEEEEE
ncbi:MAG TPA: 50S ribosomal protein L25 [Acetomicrobium flavidum]|uniref:Large ribosomal subunit protein bL25 n=2 Tax=Acetomicrobium TaxID=49894 RepID=I4BVL7_ACEMN|nr:50S ribosomal protein L25 [Acetomicrobium mobile]NLG94999.1 50S ribosomal protein L25 [Acetomicrobium flavidum]AFM21324.1 ribosomal protein L25, Ctc-form [Acetomicrobium mobile DSM 13181]SIN63586.1 large subunit ribosomal protein L25 [Acetomicrobium flavidum]HOJ82118.1 50S ribosomal protein L25 [Acetomicrobium flavidum]HOM31236.1 50S ribosomal protein L25 [Acetomicrobium flavidum]